MAFGTEIADSDAESEGEIDLATAPASQQLPRACLPNDSPTRIPEIDLGVNFSDFLSQTRYCDTQNSNTTQVMMMTSSKRSHSDMVRPGHMQGSPAKRRNRQKTYASNRCLRSSQSELFLEEKSGHLAEDLHITDGSQVLESGLLGSPPSPQQNSQPNCADSLSAEGIVDETEDLLLPQYEVEAGMQSEAGSDAHGLKSNPQMASEQTATRSLVGKYAPINLEFGQSGIGTDLVTNPFGDPQTDPENFGLGPSEISNDHLDHLDRDSLAPRSLGGSSVVQIDRNHAGRSLSANVGGEDAFSPRPSSNRSRSYVDPALLVRNRPDDSTSPAPTSVSSRKRQKTEECASPTSLKEVPEAALEPRSKRAAQPKKRGRKSRNLSTWTESPDPTEETQDLVGTKVKQNTVPEMTSSSERRLDEMVIGLPKEAYKPRPSRSRAKQTLEETMSPPLEATVELATSLEKPPATPCMDESAERVEPEDTPLTKIKRDKRKKNKMKRAKTSAAALLGKSAKMLSDGEEDVVWVEEKPATVKMSIPDLFEVKVEQTLDLDATEPEQADHNEDDTGSNTEAKSGKTVARDNSISVVIPPKDSVPETVPKKRGRKPRKSVDPPAIHEEPTEAAELATEPSSPVRKSKQQQSSSRQALREKDTNSTVRSATPPSPGSSTIKVAERNLGSGETHPATPVKGQDLSSAEADISGRLRNDLANGPTKHSPINPSGGKIRYRVGLSRRATIPPLLKIVRK